MLSVYEKVLKLVNDILFYFRILNWETHHSQLIDHDDFAGA